MSMQDTVFAGLSNSLHPCRIAKDRSFRSWNVMLDREIVEVRNGFGQLTTWSGIHAGDRLLGAGTGAINGQFELVTVVQPFGVSTAMMRVHKSDGTNYTHTSTGWLNRGLGRWSFAQYEDYLYAANPSDGLWRKRLGDSAAKSWEAVPTILQSIANINTNVSFERPNYPMRNWDSGDTVVPYAPDFFAPGDGSAGNEAEITAAGSFVLKQSGNLASTASMTAWFVAKFAGTDGINLRDQRYLGTEVRLGCDWDDTRKHEEPHFNSSGQPFVFVSDSATATPGPPWTGWKQARIYLTPLESSPVWAGRTVTYGVGIDLDQTHNNTSSTTLTTVRQIAIGIPVSSGNDFTVTLMPIRLGGTMLNKNYWANMMTADPLTSYRDQLGDIEYAITSFNTTSGQESTATLKRVAKTDAFGIQVADGNIPLGAKAKISLSDPAPGFDRVRLYRKRLSDGGKWWLIAEEPAAIEIVDARVDAPEDPTPWNLIGGVKKESSAEFGSIQSDLKPQAIAVWKQHIVLGVGPEVYMSSQGVPTQYLLPARLSGNGAVATDDPTIGRTLSMSNDLSDTVLALVAQDHLYGVGNQGVYVMMGDSARSASPFRKMTGSQGALSPDAVARFGHGVIVGSHSGLYYYEASALYSGLVEQQAIERELTTDIRTSWQELIGDDPAGLVVSESGGEIWCFNGNDYLHRSRTGTWAGGRLNADGLIHGELPGTSPEALGTLVPLPELPPTSGSETDALEDYISTSLVDARSPRAVAASLHVASGLHILVSKTGRTFLFGKSSSGESFRNDVGRAIPWAVRTGYWDMPMRVRLTGCATIIVSPNAEVTARFIAQGFDGQSGATTYAQDRNRTIFAEPFGTLPASRWTIALAGQCAGMEVQRLAIEWDRTTDGGAN